MSRDPFDGRSDMTEAERAAFASLSRQASPSSALEERVVAALKETGTLRERRSLFVRFGVPIGALAAAGILFAAGVAAGRRQSTPAADARPEFVLFLLEGKDFDRGTGAPNEHVAEYKRWAENLGKQGLLVGGEKLGQEGLSLSRNRTDIVVEKERVDGESSPQGYFVIRARDVDQALAIAKDCPHVRHGGRISLRPIEKV